MCNNTTPAHFSSPTRVVHSEGASLVPFLFSLAAARRLMLLLLPLLLMYYMHPYRRFLCPSFACKRTVCVCVRALATVCGFTPGCSLLQRQVRVIVSSPVLWCVYITRAFPPRFVGVSPWCALVYRPRADYITHSVCCGFSLFACCWIFPKVGRLFINL